MGAIAPILFQQAIPIFADVDPVTLNITPETVAARITHRTRAIIATHLFGNPCDVVGITRIAVARGIPVIEDCGQAFLATQHGQLVGTIGRMGVFSLSQSAHMTAGEGGVIVTSDDTIARAATLFRDKGWGYGDPDPDYYILGLNYRMTELQGAVARIQLQKLTRAVRRRRRTAERLGEQLAHVPGLTLPEASPGSTHVYWRYALNIDPDAIRGGSDALAAALRARGVPCVPHYLSKPPFQSRTFTERKTYGRSRCPFSCRLRDGGSEVVYDAADYPGTMRGLEQVLVLPWNELYTDEHVRYIARAVEESVRGLTRRSVDVGRAQSHDTLQ
jgi:dTDP-4-amino-4,6-dideoxygalactose transaminase